jgi:hypothetical protein
LSAGLVTADAIYKEVTSSDDVLVRRDHCRVFLFHDKVPFKPVVGLGLG